MHPCRKQLPIYGLFFSICLLSACGFQLRGQLPQLGHLPQPWQIQGVASSSTLYQDMTHQLQQAGITVTTTNGKRFLMVSEVRNTARLLSVDRDNAALEQELTLAFQFALQIPGQDQPPPTALRTTRILLQSQADRLSSDREATQLQAHMRRELVTRMVQILAAATPHSSEHL